MMRHWTLYAPSASSLTVALAAIVAGCGLDLQGKLTDDAGTSSSTSSKRDGGSSSGSSGGDDSSSGALTRDDDASVGSGSGDSGAGGSGGDDGSAPARGGDAGPGGPDAGPACDFSGTWATHLTIGVDWIPQGLTGVILAPGTGQIEQWIESTRTQSGNVTSDTAAVCGITLPDFAGTSFAGGEIYAIRFPDSLFDNHDIPAFTIPGKLGDSSANSTFTTSLTPVLLGLALGQPTTTPWPATITTTTDPEADGSPGVTAIPATGPAPGAAMKTYSDTPVDIYGDRADQIDIVIRQVTSLSGSATDCDHISGTVSIPRIPDTGSGKYAIDSHVVGCDVAGGGGPCTQAQAGFLDATQPVFSPLSATAFTSIRVPATTTCAAVRHMFP